MFEVFKERTLVSIWGDNLEKDYLSLVWKIFIVFTIKIKNTDQLSINNANFIAHNDFQ